MPITRPGINFKNGSNVTIATADNAGLGAVDVTISATGGGGGLPADTVVPATTRIIANSLAAGDANNAWRVRGDGRLDWGPGGATALDTNLYRNAPGDLRTNGMFVAATAVYAGVTGQWLAMGPYGPSSQAAVDFAGDTYLYRHAAGYLRTPGSFIADSLLFCSGSYINHKSCYFFEAEATGSFGTQFLLTSSAGALGGLAGLVLLRYHVTGTPASAGCFLAMIVTTSTISQTIGIAGIPLPSGANPTVAVTSGGNVYVTVPTTGGYSGSVNAYGELIVF